MHLVLVSAQHHPSHGGIGAYVWELTHAARQAGWRLDLITRPSEALPSVPANNLHALVTQDTQPDFTRRTAALRRLERIRPYRYGLWSLAIARKLLELDDRPDAIEFVDCQAEGFVSLLSRELRERYIGTKMLVSAHTPMWLHELHAGADSRRFGRFMYHDWERRAVAAADAVLAPSRMLLDRLGSLPRAMVLPFPMRAKSACSPAQDQVIVLVGAVQPQKGVHVWARSLNRVLMSKPRATALLIGPDTPTAPDGLSMAAHVQRLIDPRCIDRFRWLGALPHDHVMRIIDDAALVVVPSLFESFSFAAAEAIMRGRPVVVSHNVGLAEHVPGLTSVPVHDADALADAQLAILNDMPGAHDRAIDVRRMLLSACDPANYIARRAEFTRASMPFALTAERCANADAIHEMDAYVRSIDQAVSASVSLDSECKVLATN